MSPTGPYAKGIAKREEILTAALGVIARLGCRKAAIREIAEAAGLSHAGLVHYFGSREALYEQVLRERDERDAAMFDEVEPTFAMYVKLVEHNATVPGLVQLFIEYSAEASAPGHPSRDFFVDRYNRIRAALSRAVIVAQRNGEVGPQVQPESVADVIMATTDGLQLQWSLDRSVDMVGRLRELWDGVRRTSWALDPLP
ncbi:TetR/AcrR family transcriptional regulator [Microbacterium sp.]|uniref:TetR/AcrR family transcriptional regulator n=1 Tax=Microbacterium sp. TaxID=51671 RepID=UPI003A84CE8A